MNSLSNLAPKISVIIPLYNTAHLVVDAINSVYLQNYSNLELIIVDDGSTDDVASLGLKEQYALHYYYIPHSGAAAARNYGVEQATGEYLAFLDADDLWPKEKLKQQLLCLQAQNLDAVFTSIQQCLHQNSHHTIKEELKHQPGLCASTLLIRRDKFLQIGFFNTRYCIGEFIEWFMRAKHSLLRYEVLHNLITLRRIHGENTSLRMKSHKKDYLAALYSGLKNKEAVHDECNT